MKGWEAKLRFLQARLFGERMTGYDSGVTCIAYKWRGNIYVVDFVDDT